MPDANNHEPTWARFDRIDLFCWLAVVLSWSKSLSSAAGWGFRRRVGTR